MLDLESIAFLNEALQKRLTEAKDPTPLLVFISASDASRAIVDLISEVELLRQIARDFTAVASIYINAFKDDEVMTLPEKFMLQEIEESYRKSIEYFNT